MGGEGRSVWLVGSAEGLMEEYGRGIRGVLLGR